MSAKIARSSSPSYSSSSSHSAISRTSRNPLDVRCGGAIRHAHPRSSTITIRIGTAIVAQSNILAIMSRRSRRRVDLLASTLSDHNRTYHSSGNTTALALSRSNLLCASLNAGYADDCYFTAALRTVCTQPFKSSTAIKFTMRSAGSFARSAAANPSSINSNCHG